ncbi:MAG: RsmD family RNA methyltransferase [Actinomycetota bacterium]
MTRIIAGFAGSIALKTPGAGTRPTSDRVREAIFSALEARGVIEGARVLDLYAGSGALGLEAASRGAAFVRLVERSGAGTTVCRSNSAAVLARAPGGSSLGIEVSGRLVQSFLTSNPETWDLVFLDPPYDLAEAELAGNLRSLAPRLEADAVLCLERGSRSPEPTWPPGIELDRRTVYGDTTLWWARGVDVPGGPASGGPASGG